MMFIDENACRQRIQNLRRMSGLTQEELADRISISANHLAKIESGIRFPSLDVLAQLSEYFHVTLDFLVFGHTVREISLEEQALTLAEGLTVFASAKMLSNNMDK